MKVPDQPSGAQHNEKKKGSETICKVNNINRVELKFLSYLPQEASSSDMIMIRTKIP